MAAQQTFAFFQSDDVISSGKDARKSVTSRSKTLGAGQKVSRTQRVSRTQQVSGTPISKVSPSDKSAHTPPPRVAPENDVASESVVSQLPDRAASRDEILKRLRVQAGCVSTAPTDTRPRLSTGCRAIDQWLPSGGLKIDALTEWVGQSDSSGAAMMSLITAAGHLKQCPSKPLVVVDDSHQFYPPAAVALGIPESQIILVRPKQRADVVWAIDQALRCDEVAAVWAPVGAWLDDRDARRFQLASETGNTPALLVRPVQVRGRPSFAEVRFHVVAGQHEFSTEDFVAQVTLDRCRGDSVGKQIWIQLDRLGQLIPVNTPQLNRSSSTPLMIDDPTASKQPTAAVHLAGQLAHPETTPPATETQRRHRA